MFEPEKNKIDVIERNRIWNENKQKSNKFGLTYRN